MTMKNRFFVCQFVDKPEAQDAYASERHVSCRKISVRNIILTVLFTSAIPKLVLQNVKKTIAQKDAERYVDMEAYAANMELGGERDQDIKKLI